jgi:hypothetical protein
MATADINGAARRNLSARYPATERNRVTASRQRIFAAPPVSPAAPGPGGVSFGGPSFEANRRYPVHYLRQARIRAKFFPPQGWQPPKLPGNQVTTGALFVSRRLGSTYVRRLVQRSKAFHQAFAAPLPPVPGGVIFGTPAFKAERRYAAAYHRVLRDRTRVFISGGGILRPTSPLLSATATLTASAVNTASAAVAFSGTGSMAVFVSDTALWTGLSYVPADTSLVLSGYTLAEQAECNLGTGTNAASGTTNYGFADTTYTLSKAQILATCSTSVL